MSCIGPLKVNYIHIYFHILFMIMKADVIQTSHGHSWLSLAHWLHREIIECLSSVISCVSVINSRKHNTNNCNDIIIITQSRVCFSDVTKLLQETGHQKITSTHQFLLLSNIMNGKTPQAQDK